MLIPNVFAAAAVLSTFVAGLPITTEDGANEATLSKRTPIGAGAFGVIPISVKAHPNAPFNRMDKIYLNNPPDIPYTGKFPLPWNHSPKSPKSPKYDADVELGKLALMHAYKIKQKEAKVAAAKAAAAVPKPAAAPGKVTWDKKSHEIYEKRPVKRSENSDDLLSNDGDLTKRTLGSSIKAALGKTPKAPAPVYPAVRPQGSVLKYPAGHPDASQPKRKIVQWSRNEKRSENVEETVEEIEKRDPFGARLGASMKSGFSALRSKFSKKPKPPPVPVYPAHRPQGSALKYPAGHPDASPKKGKVVQWA